jgi:hypothetical protein
MIDWQEAYQTVLRDNERLRAIIKKQMEPNEISKRLAECNELQDAYFEQKAEVERLQVKLQTLEAMAHGALLYEKNAEIERLRAELAQAVAEREDYNSKHQGACLELERRK